MRPLHIAAEPPTEEADQYGQNGQHRKKHGVQIRRILHNRTDIHIKNVRISLLIFVGFNLSQAKNKAASAGFQGVKLIGGGLLAPAVFPKPLLGSREIFRLEELALDFKVSDARRQKMLLNISLAAVDIGKRDGRLLLILQKDRLLRLRRQIFRNKDVDGSEK